MTTNLPALDVEPVTTRGEGQAPAVGGAEGVDPSAEAKPKTPVSTLDWFELWSAEPAWSRESRHWMLQFIRDIQLRSYRAGFEKGKEFEKEARHPRRD